ncbi:hypothetical protein, partial [Roseimaritima sediminicola]|uniref:hypothetical protein n=1 Tax=Roseimaritima sediminicola TaxID=2662066 RepID=UPI0012985582
MSPRIAQTVAPGLNRLVDHLYDPRWWQPRTNFDHRVAMLRQWASRRSALPTNREHPVLGAYHECLTLMGPEVCAAWNRPALLVVEAETPRTPPAGTNGAATVRHRKIVAAWQ